MYFLYLYEYGTLKPIQVILRRRMGKGETNDRDEPNQGNICIYENITMKLPTYLLYTNKMFKKNTDCKYNHEIC
jgi:hypothetical protein